MIVRVVLLLQLLMSVRHVLCCITTESISWVPRKTISDPLLSVLQFSWEYPGFSSSRDTTIENEES